MALNSMNEALKKKQDELTIDDEVLSDSSNPVENQAIASAISKKVTGTGTFNVGHYGNGDLNKLVTAGMYRVDKPTNGPSGKGSYAQVIVVHGNADTLAQLLFPYDESGVFYLRQGNGVSDTAWTGADWYKFTGTKF